MNTSISQIILPPNAAVVLGEAANYFIEAGMDLPLQGNDPRLAAFLKADDPDRATIVFDNTYDNRSAAVQILQTAAKGSHEKDLAPLFSRLSDLIRKFDHSVLSEKEARQEIDQMAAETQKWREALFFQQKKFNELVRNTLLPLAQKIEEYADHIEAGAAKVLSHGFFEAWDILEVLTGPQKTSKPEYHQILGAIYMVAGIHLTNKSLRTIHEKFFDGDRDRTAHLIAGRNLDSIAMLISPNYRLQGFFAKSIHGEDNLRTLGKACSYYARAERRRNMTDILRMVATFTKEWKDTGDLVAEHSRINLYHEASKKLERYLKYHPDRKNKLFNHSQQMQRYVRSSHEQLRRQLHRSS